MRPLNATLLSPALASRRSVPRVVTSVHLFALRSLAVGLTQRAFDSRPAVSCAILIVTAPATERRKRNADPSGGFFFAAVTGVAADPTAKDDRNMEND